MHRYLPYISPTSPLHLPYIPPTSPLQVHEEDKEYAGGAVFVGSRAELREALARIALQKVGDALKEAALRELERRIGPAAHAAKEVLAYISPTPPYIFPISPP
jgi:hypothetical protein